MSRWFIVGALIGAIVGYLVPMPMVEIHRVGVRVDWDKEFVPSVDVLRGSWRARYCGLYDSECVYL